MFIRARRLWYSLSGALILASAAIVGTVGLPAGIDFTGGSEMTLEFSQTVPDRAEVLTALADLGPAVGVDLSTANVRTAGTEALGIRTPELDAAAHAAVSAGLAERLPAFTEVQFQSIGGLISDTFKVRAGWAIGLAVVAIILFVAWAFRNVPAEVSAWRMGFAAIAALVHDLAIVTGLFAVGAAVWGWEADLLFVTALLTILGFSVNDTIVVFDRLREKVLNAPKNADLAPLAEKALAETLTRSLNTSLSTLVVLLALVIAGADAIRPFAATLAAGMVVGTYSSLCVATPLLVTWAKKSEK